MKKVLATVLVCVFMIGTLFSLSSCGKTVSGTYEGTLDLGFVSYTVTYAFKGNNVEITSRLSSAVGSYSSNPVNATYQLDEDENGNMTITFDYGDAEAEDGMQEEGIALSFVEGEENGVKYIKIAGVKYNKVNK